MIAIDFGANAKFVAFGNDGPIDFPKPKHGTNKRGVAGKLEYALEALLDADDVAIESASIGSSGLEGESVKDIAARSKNKLWLLSGRAVKNLHGKQAEDLLAAKTIYEIATTHPDRLKLWKYVVPQDKLVRKHTSVRPYDQRAYRSPEVDEWMSVLPDVADLPESLQRWFVKKLKTKQYYIAAKVLPFAMAMDEPSVVDRKSFERVIGLGEHGYPSFYRRATVALMQVIAKAQTGKTKNAEITPAERKAAWIETRRTLRHLYALMK